MRGSKPRRGSALADEVEHASRRVSGPVPADEEEVLVELHVGAELGARLVDREERQLARVDAARARMISERAAWR